MRKQIRRRPEVEGLEAMTLLSGMSGVAPPVEALAKTPALPNPLHFVGTLNCTLTTNGHGETLKAVGKLSPFGKVSFSGPAAGASVSGGLSNLTIPGKQGKLFLSLNLTTPAGGTTESGTYTVTGGTKTLAGETGSGAVTVTITSVASPIHFTATFS